MVQLYAFPERSKRAAAAAAAARRQAAAAETGAIRPLGIEVPATAAGDAEMEDVAAAAATSPPAATTTDGGGAAAEAEGLPVLLLRELASFRARFPRRVGKHLRADAAELVLKHQVRVDRVGSIFVEGLFGRPALYFCVVRLCISVLCARVSSNRLWEEFFFFSVSPSLLVVLVQPTALGHGSSVSPQFGA